MSTIERVDFFISYNVDDTDWATWIAGQLEGAGYRTIVDAWDFLPGGNWVLLMDDACKRADRIIVVLSPSFLAKGVFVQPEYATFFAADPLGQQRLLVPVMIKKCEPTGLLRSLIPIRLVDKTEPQARTELLAGLGDKRPVPQPPFPGNGNRPPFPPTITRPAKDRPPPTETLAKHRRSDAQRPGPEVKWTPVDSWPQPRWLAELYPVPTGCHVLEAHLVPAPGFPPVPSQEPTYVSGRLAALGRGCGLFSPEQSLDLRSTEQLMGAVDPTTLANGVAMLDTGQCTAWCEIPTDAPTELGTHIAEQLAKLLHLIVQIRMAEPTAPIALAVGLLPDGRKVAPDRHIPTALLDSAHREIAVELADRILGS